MCLSSLPLHFTPPCFSALREVEVRGGVVVWLDRRGKRLLCLDHVQPFKDDAEVLLKMRSYRLFFLFRQVPANDTRGT
jgi:hypothetical protein